MNFQKKQAKKWTKCIPATLYYTKTLLDTVIFKGNDYI